MSVEAGQDQVSDLETGIRQFQERILSDYARFSPQGPIDIVERRRIAEQVRDEWKRGGPDMARTTDLQAGDRGVRIRIHNPTGDPELPVLIYVHGGGWMLFSVDTHDRLMREYAGRANVTVVGVDYSLAPEAKFPVPVEEILSVVRWIRSAESDEHLRPSRIAIGGDSAGGNLALAANLALREAGEPMLDALLVNYGALDTESRQSHGRYGGPDYMLTPEEMTDFWDNYARPEDRDNPLARPLLGDLAGLPPTFICVAECDILADENWELERRLREAGVPVVAKNYPGATHSFLEAVSISKLAERALEDASSWLSEVLRR